MIKVTFLGTSDAIPSATRNHTSMLLDYNGEHILVDCGEGTQRQLRKAKINPCKITKILITHWHGDHVLGLPGLFQTLALSGYKKTLSIYGPKGTKKFIQEMLKVFVFVNKFPMKVFEIKKEGKFFETPGFYLESKKMIHGPHCNAYNFVKKGKLRIDKKKLKKSKLPHGPLLGRLKQGKNISYKGKRYLAKNFTYGETDKKISFVLDTGLNKKIIPFVKDADLLISESSFGAELERRAKEYKHLTSKQAATIAKKAKVKKLVLTHISQRYSKNPKKILGEAKKIFKNSILAKDLDVVEI